MEETIIALASGSLPSAIAIIRVSGPQAKNLVEKHTKAKHTPWQQKLVWFSRETTRIDQIMSCVFPGPQSYTGEDVWEISCHGGKAVVGSILDTLLTYDHVRLAEPGEFTRRAVENGKMDLLQAEAIADLIAAESPSQQDLALGQLSGEFSAVCANWQNKLLEVRARLEALIDFPDESDVTLSTQSILTPLTEIIDSLTAALHNRQTGETIRDGLVIAIIGPPNVGKSSLFNALLSEDRAIVTDIAGTTRDYISQNGVIAGQAVILVDTAGLHETDDPVEKAGITRTQALAETAHIRIIMQDVNSMTGAQTVKPRHSDLNVINKADLQELFVNVSRETSLISVKSGFGLDTFLKKLEAQILILTQSTEAPLITRRRHAEAIKVGLELLKQAEQQLTQNTPPELIAETVRMANDALNLLTGHIDSEDVLGHIFGAFCIGK